LKDRIARFGGSVVGDNAGSLSNAQLGGADAVADYYKYNYQSQYNNTPERNAELKQIIDQRNSSLPSPVTPSTASSQAWRDQQTAWQSMKVPTVDSWRGAWTGKSVGSTGTVQPIRITSQLVVDARVLAEAISMHNERMGYA
jgi:hypothetical protein